MFFCACAVLIVGSTMGWLISKAVRTARLRNAVAQEAGMASRDAVSSGTREVTEMERPELDVRLLTPNEYSRPGTSLERVNGIVVHYTANPGTGALANRNYFEGLKDTHATKASSHFIIGLDGEIVQCVPCSEWAYASNERNEDTISIECCIPDESGEFTGATYASLVELSSWLCFRYGLTADDLLRHYDVTGKICPKNFVEHPSEWDGFREDVRDYMERRAND